MRRNRFLSIRHGKQLQLHDIYIYIYPTPQLHLFGGSKNVQLQVLVGKFDPQYLPFTWGEESGSPI